MAKLTVKKFERPDETRPFEKGRAEILYLAGGTAGRVYFEPGWKWSKCVKPIAGTESCQMDHFGIMQAGRMHVRMNDGQESEAGPGDVLRIPPGHDAWVVGDETCVFLDFGGMEHYAERAVGTPLRTDAPPEQPGAY